MEKVKEGDHVLLYDGRKRKFLVKAEYGRQLHTDKGIIELGELVDRIYGTKIKTHLGKEFYILKPNFEDLVYGLFERKTQVLYPKDIGYMIVKAAISNGSRVVEAGTGSGVLTAFLARAVAPDGKVYSYEVREEYIELAKRNLARVGLSESVVLKNKDVTKGIEEVEIDAVFLDMPNPWEVIPSAFHSLKHGGVFLAFVPTVNQMEKTAIRLREEGFHFVECVELMLRNYRVSVIEGVRPSTLGIRHTGYIISARKP